MTSNNFKMGSPRRAGTSAALEHGREAGDHPRDLRGGRDGEHRRASARHPAEPVVRLAQAGVPRGNDGDGRRSGGRSGIRTPGASGPGEGVAALVGQEDDGEQNPEGSARDLWRPKKTSVALVLSSEGDFGMKTVCETLVVARSNIAARAAGSPSRARGRPPLPDRELVEDIKAVIADTPTYGYRRVHAILRRNARKLGRS